MRAMKQMKLIIVTVSMFLALGTFSYGQSETHKIIFQFTNANDTLQQKAFVKQLENLIEYWPKAKYEVVLYNQGLELVMKSNKTYLGTLKTLHAKGVRFVVCENTLKNRNISKESFDTWIEYVPAGIAEIVEKQELGWSYIKGGF
jgi:intracellular sulfur oxidation DsrE/DsrF family protein